MKKTVALIMALILLLSCSLASAETPRYRTTQSFINALTDTKYSLTVASSNDDNDQVHIGFNDSDFSFNFFFDSSNHVCIRVWTTKTISAGKNYALDVVNQLNNTYKWAKFLLDTEDNTITINWDAVIPDDCGVIVTEMYLRLLMEITDDSIIAKINSLY